MKAFTKLFRAFFELGMFITPVIFNSCELICHESNKYILKNLDMDSSYFSKWAEQMCWLLAGYVALLIFV